MLPLINQAVLAGYTADQILSFLGNNLKNLMPGIKEAKNQGYTAQDILQFIGGNLRSKKPKNIDKGVSENEQYLKNMGYKTAEEKEATRSKFIQGAFTLASTALGGYALARSVPKAAQALISQFGVGATAPAVAEAAAPAVTQGIQKALPAAEEVAKQIAPVAAKKAPLQIPQALSQTLEALLSKNPPEAAAAVLKKIQPQIVKEWEKEAGIPFEEGVKEFAKTFQPQQKHPPQTIKENISISPEGTKVTSEKMQPKFGQMPSEAPLGEERPQEPEIKQKKLVSLPDGTIGELMNVRKGIAEVNQEGKIRRRKESELIESPLPEKDLGELYGELIQKIPESERSSNINVAAYDANSNSLLVRFHNGAYYVYENIDQEFADKLKNSMFQAKTTGENFFGAWSKGEGSRGAGLYALIKDLQKHYGGKGKEYSRKYETIHSLLGLAEKAHKEKLDEQKKRKRKLG